LIEELLDLSGFGKGRQGEAVVRLGAALERFVHDLVGLLCAHVAYKTGHPGDEQVDLPLISPAKAALVAAGRFLSHVDLWFTSSWLFSTRHPPSRRLWPRRRSSQKSRSESLSTSSIGLPEWLEDDGVELLLDLGYLAGGDLDV